MTPKIPQARRGLLACACALALLAGAAPATASAAKPPDGFFGVLPGAPLEPSEYQRMADGGVESVRIFMAMSIVEPTQGTQDWSHYDEIVRASATAGLTIFPSLFAAPGWLTGKPAMLPVFKPFQRSQWSRFVAQVAARYGPKGEFWTMNQQLPYRPIKHVQLWNETNIDEFVAGKTKPRFYARLVKITDRALASVNPKIRLGLAGLFRRPRRGTGVEMTTYLKRLYRTPKIKRHFDAVAVHPYAKRPGDVLRVLRRARRVMAENGDRKTPLWVTELGWTTGGKLFKRSPYKAGYKGQARKLAKTFRLLKRNQRRLKIHRVYWHTWRDYDIAPNFWTQYMGLFDAAGSPKPAWFAYARAAGGQP